MPQRDDKPVSLYPMTPDEAIEEALRTPPPPKVRRGTYGGRSRPYVPKFKPGYLEVVANDDGTFNICYGGTQIKNSIPEESLEYELCVRYGFCGKEYDDIVRELKNSGKFISQF